MQHFDNLESGRDEDFDDYNYYSRDSKKVHYEEDLKQFYYIYEDASGYEWELLTSIECIWKVVPPDYSSWDSPEDYYGYTELTAWKIVSVENTQGDKINPEEVLTDKQLEDYNAAMLNFVEG